MHEHAFFMDNRYWSEYAACYSAKMRGDERLTKSRKLEEETPKPAVIKCVGAAPEQYPQNEGFPEIYPPEVCQELYQAISVPPETVELLRQYIQAAANLYGRLPLRDLLTLYNSYNAPISEERFIAIAEILRHEDLGHCAILGQEVFYEDEEPSAPMEREVLAEYLWALDNDDYYEIVEKQRGKPLKILPQKEFLRYTDDDHIPNTPQKAALLQFLRGRVRSQVNTPEDIMFEMSMGMTLGHEFSYLFAEAQRPGVTFRSQQDAQAFATLLQELNNHTHKHANRGHTPMELSIAFVGRPLMPTQIPVVPPAEPPRLTLMGAPSRNAPCPCGSGRKYKNCCGKSK